MKKLILLYLLTLSYSQDHWETAIYANDEWSYLVPIEEPNSNWNSLNYDDSSWLVSTGGFGCRQSLSMTCLLIAHIIVD